MMQLNAERLTDCIAEANTRTVTNTPIAPSYNNIIVIVDDEQPMLNALQRLLFDCDFTLHCFDNAKEAWEFCRNNTVAVVLSDVRMPHMDGVELMTLVAKEQPLSERILLTGFADMEVTVGAINKGRISFYIDKPWDDERLIRILKKGVESANIRIRNAYLEKLTLAQNSELKQWNETLEEQVSSRTEKLRNSYLSATQVLSSLIDRRLRESQFNNNDIVRLALRIGRKLSWSDDALQDLGMASMLCQIGKIGFSDALLNKPRLSLSLEELSEFSQHPNYAASSLAFAPPLSNIAITLRQHRETLDGKGYPSGLKSDAIKEEALLLGLVSTFVELLNGQYFERALTHGEAITFLKELSEKHYSKPMVDAACVIFDQWQQKLGQFEEHCLPASKLAAGMMLTRNLYTPSGVLVLAKNKELTVGIIAHLSALERNLKFEIDAYVAPEPH